MNPHDREHLTKEGGALGAVEGAGKSMGGGAVPRGVEIVEGGKFGGCPSSIVSRPTSAHADAATHDPIVTSTPNAIKPRVAAVDGYGRRT